MLTLSLSHILPPSRSPSAAMATFARLHRTALLDALSDWQWRQLVVTGEAAHFFQDRCAHAAAFRPAGPLLVRVHVRVHACLKKVTKARPHVHVCASVCVRVRACVRVRLCVAKGKNECVRVRVYVCSTGRGDEKDGGPRDHKVEAWIRKRKAHEGSRLANAADIPCGPSHPEFPVHVHRTDDRRWGVTHGWRWRRVRSWSRCGLWRGGGGPRCLTSSAPWRGSRCARVCVDVCVGRGCSFRHRGAVCVQLWAFLF